MIDYSWLDATNFISTAFCLRLTVTLLHFLWQGATIAAAVALLGCFMQSARHRYLLNVTALLLMAACLPATYSWLSGRTQYDSSALSQWTGPDSTSSITTAGRRSPVPNRKLTGPLSNSTHEEVAAQSAARRSPFDSAHENTRARSDDAGTMGNRRADEEARHSLQWVAPYAAGLYVLGVLAMLLRIGTGLWQGWRIERQSLPVKDERLLDLIRRQAQRVGLSVAPAVFYCRRVSVPMVVGLWKPAILLPTSLASGLPPDLLQSLITHELAHVRRYDLLVNLMQRIVEAALFFHPAVWYISGRVGVERENACDDTVLTAGCQRMQYIEALIRMAELCGVLGESTTVRAASLAATGQRPSQFKRRVLRLMGDDNRPRLRISTWSLSITLVLLVATAATPLLVQAWGRQADTPTTHSSGTQPTNTANSKTPVSKAIDTAAPDTAAPDTANADKANADKVRASAQWKLRIRAVDEATGRPIAQPRIAVQLGSKTTWHTGNAAGEFTVTLPTRTPRYCYLRARAKGYVPMRAFWKNRQGQPADEMPKTFAFPMAKAVTVGGIVVDEDGKPVAGAQVLFGAADHKTHPGRRAEQSFYQEKLTTDVRGRWTCDLAPPHMSSGSIKVTHTDFAFPQPSWSVDSRIDQLRKQTFSWTLRRGATIRGRVVDGSGNPVVGAVLAVGELNLYRTPKKFPKTNAQGHYTIKGVARYLDLPDNAVNRHTITVVKSGFAPQMKQIPTAETNPDNPARGGEHVVDFQLGAGVPVHFRVVDNDGRPLKGVWIFPNQWRGTDALRVLRQFGIPSETDEDGNWHWDWAPPGDKIDYDMLLRGYMDVRNYGFAPVNGNPPVTITLRRPQVITGRVVDAATNKPVDDFRIEKGFANRASEPGGIYWSTSSRGRKGQYRKVITMPHAAGYHYRVLADGYEAAVSRLVPVREGGVKIDFALTRRQAKNKNDQPKGDGTQKPSKRANE